MEMYSNSNLNTTDYVLRYIREIICISKAKALDIIILCIRKTKIAGFDAFVMHCVAPPHETPCHRNQL